MRGAAMSLTAAASGFVLFLLSLPVVQGRNGWSVDYTSTQICAIKGSTVDISCTYNSYYKQIGSTSWFRSGRGSEDLRKVSQYEGRVEVTDTERGRSTLRIRDLRESDSAEYHFKFKTRSSEWTSSLPGTTLTVTDVQVQVTGRRLDCVTRCNPYVSSYVWYINGEQVDGASSPSYEISNEESSDDENSYSCALKGFEDFHSPLIYAPKVVSAVANYSGEIVEGSSVTLTCSSDANPAANYTWYKEDEESPQASGQNFTITDVRPEHSGSYYCVALNTRGHHNSTLCQINIASSVNSAAVGSITVLFLTLLILSAIIVIRKRRSLTQFFSRKRPNSKVQQSVCPEYEDPSAAAQSVAAEQQEDLCYASVSFSKNQDDPVYSNIKPTKPSRQKEEDEEEAEYTLVKISNGAQGLRGQQAVEDSSALYSTVNKNFRVST